MKSVLIIGLGRFGRHMAKKFIEEGNSVLAVEISEARADNAVNIINNIEIGDSTSEEFIDSLGVNNFDICVVAIGENFQAALETTVLLKDLGAPFIIARACRSVHKKLLLRNGADYVVYAEKETAERLAIKYGAKNIFDYIELDNETAIYEVAVPNNWVGKTIIQLDIRKKYNISILATKQDGIIQSLPSPEHIFEKDENLIVLAGNKSIKSITK